MFFAQNFSGFLQQNKLYDLDLSMSVDVLLLLFILLGLWAIATVDELFNYSIFQ